MADLAVVRTLAECEQAMREGKAMAWKAMKDIRDQRLYREKGYGRFEDYCEKEWGLTRGRAYQLMDAGEVTGLLEMSTNCIHLPETESQARELAPLMRQDEAAAVEVWHDLHEQYGDRVTAAKVKTAVQTRMNREIVRERVPMPHVPIKATADNPTLVLADPPWRYDFSETESREIENQYPTATVAEIIEHKPTTDGNCVLFMWATAPKLTEALAVMEGWGFTFKTCAVWDKEKIGMGYWFRGQHELLLVGTLGNVHPPTPDNRVSSVFREKRQEHSQKPLCVYEWIEAAFPEAVKLEMYCRVSRPGWQTWGNGL